MRALPVRVRSIDSWCFPLSCVNVISPHATKVARPTNLPCRLNSILLWLLRPVGRGWIFYLRTATQQTVALRTKSAAICFSYVLGRSGKAEAGQAKYSALFPRRFHFI